MKETFNFIKKTTKKEFNNYILSNCVSDQMSETNAIGATYILVFLNMEVATHKVTKKYNY